MCVCVCACVHVRAHVCACVLCVFCVCLMFQCICICVKHVIFYTEIWFERRIVALCSVLFIALVMWAELEVSHF